MPKQYLEFTLTEQQALLLKELLQRGSLDSLKHCVNGIDELDGFQTAAIAYSLVVEKCLLNIDTGLGKTLIAAGVINVLKTIEPSVRWVYICQCSNLKTTADKLKKHLFDASLIYCDSTDAGILYNFYSVRARNADVMVLSYEAIVNPEVEGFLFTNKDKFQGIILDESQMLSNLSSHTSRLVSAMLNSVRYKILLSATPLRVSVEQVINQMYMIDRTMFAGVTMSTFLNQYRIWDGRSVVGYRDLDELETQLLPRMLSLSRTDLNARGNYTSKMCICPSGLLDDAKIDDVVDYKCLQSSSTMLKLIEIIQMYRSEGKRGLIYANRNTIKGALLDTLAGAGISVEIMDGSYTSTQRRKEEVHQKFLNKELDVLITNITTGKDLPCDYIIFYELTFDYKQMLGRGERGLDGVDLDIFFIITDSKYEMRFFYTNVYQRGLLLEQLCGKDLPELHEAYSQLLTVLQRKGVTINDLCDESTC